MPYRLRAPSRYLWLFDILGALVLVAAIDVSFSDYGHVVSVLLGLACYLVTRVAGDPAMRRAMYQPWLLKTPSSARVSDRRTG